MPTTRVSESRDREGRAGRFWRWAQHPAARTQMVNLQEKSWYFLGLPAVKGTSRPSVSRENQFSGPRAPAARSSAALPVGTAPPPPRVPPRLSFPGHHGTSLRPRCLFLLPDNSAIWCPALHRRHAFPAGKSISEHRTLDKAIFFLNTEPNSDAHIELNSKALKSLRVLFKKQRPRSYKAKRRCPRGHGVRPHRRDMKTHRELHLAETYAGRLVLSVQSFWRVYDRSDSRV